MFFGLFVNVTTTSACSHVQASSFGDTFHLPPPMRFVVREGAKLPSAAGSCLRAWLHTARGSALGRGGSPGKEPRAFF